MKYSIRAEKQEDFLLIRELHKLAFQNEGNEANLVEAIRESSYFVPGLSIVATLQSGEIIGHILFSNIILETERGAKQTLGLAPMAVHPNYQRKGVGSELVRSGLDLCKEKGFEHVFVLGHPQFYSKFGFIPASKFDIEAPFSVPDEVFTAVELRKGSLKGMEGEIKYPPAFRTVS
ncbi:N-acetyltransferase [Radiobacillus kanasensis]|uniref:GNAT family N-acetyltransferase n=1 Tax=Radiobacillus kanasensis TaxID=2844358 RepID=UPI001E4D6966|nr:N-acetyltransferase [Radiobacillus kanasensis]UFU00663.1 N-acetyltransferase [Radiobacillus kanasensis]